MAEPIELPLPNLEGLEVEKVKRTGVQIQVPVRIGIVGQAMELLEHATIQVIGRNVLTRRIIAKRVGMGTVKELWSTDDYEITITGEYRDEADSVEYPMEFVSGLANICKSRKQVRIDCQVMYALGVSYIAIQSWDISEPKNGWIRYTIKAFSDNDWDLL